MTLRVHKLMIKKLISRSEQLTADSSVSSLDSVLKDLETEYSKLRAVIEKQLIVEADEKAQVELFECLSSYEDVVSRQKIRLSDFLLTKRNQSDSSNVTANYETFLKQQQEMITALTNQTRPAPTVALPKVDITIFNGEQKSWIPFRDLFSSLIHDNPAISNVQKLQYLRSFTTSDAESLIRNIPITDNNYPIAWQTLLNTYNRPSLILNSIFCRFFECNSVSPDLNNLRQVTNTFRETFEMLHTQGSYANSRDAFALHFMLSKLDRETDSEWAKFTLNNLEPTIKDFFQFLNNQCDLYDRNATVGPKTQQRSNRATTSEKPKFTQANSLTPLNCFHCQNAHSIYKCSDFRQLPVESRDKLIRQGGRCINCLSKGHLVKNCGSRRNCFICDQRHNTLLHRENKSQTDEEEQASDLSTKEPLQINSNLSGTGSLLPTAVVNLFAFNQIVSVRVLIDTGAQGCFVSESLVNQLHLKRKQSRIPIGCLVDSKNLYSKGMVSLKLQSRHQPESKFFVNAYVLPTFQHILPSHHVEIPVLSSIQTRFQLADDTFYIPSKIDLILGASFLFEILKPSLFFYSDEKIYLQNTKLGYIVCTNSVSEPAVQLNCVSFSKTHLDNQMIQRFWELDDIVSTPDRPDFDTTECENFYKSTTYRLPSGRFSVRLPFRSPKQELGSSYGMALQRFSLLEKRFAQDATLRTEYQRFMNEYETLGHMRKTDYTFDTLPERHYVIPHHGVWHNNVNGRKLRVVFDASAKSSNGVSLNSILHTGPSLQSDIISIINKFRIYKYVVTADIEKMYRQIMIHPEDQDYQLILWRSVDTHNVNIYKLCTVTYGESCSPFLALRTIRELAYIYRDEFPTAANIVLNNSYVDDLFFGDDDLEKLQLLRVQLESLFAKCGCVLKKWTSNNSKLLAEINESSLANPLLLSDKDNQFTKTLGVVWYPQSDEFSFKFVPNNLKNWTKRTLLADTARLYDPFGWIAPLTTKLKILFQDTWIRQSGWDDPLPSDILREWQSTRDQLSRLNEIRIRRYLGDSAVELHGFSDASQVAYAAVVYSRVILGDGSISINLVAAKAKIAPIKQLSIPRLELCAAQLLAKLIYNLRNSFSNLKSINLWSDSSTVLSWIRSRPKKWSTFVGNRIGIIHELCPGIDWQYIPSKQNPADLASRGASPEFLLRATLWWRGPEMLYQSQLAITQESFTTTEELAPLRLYNIAIATDFVYEYVQRFSKFSRMVHTTCYILRLRDRALKSLSCDTLQLSAIEVRNSIKYLTKLIQNSAFRAEITRLRSDKPIDKTSKIRTLTPFLDEEGLLRVGGRLENVDDVLFNSHPWLIPPSKFADLFIRDVHERTFHGGSKLVHAHIRHEFWIIGAQKSVKRIIHSCSRCIRFRGVTFSPTMGQLPQTRVNPTKPFSVTGLDFGGPFLLKPSSGRSKIRLKAYVALFICCSTKAIHLELIMGLSTSNLILGLTRFIARRGRCHEIQSDNGRNFLACHNALKEFSENLHQSIDSDELRSFLLHQCIEWKFIPPYSPHFGGLWESGIKSVKRHFFRKFGSTLLTIEEMQTALCAIEGILNSRPLIPIAFSEPLTPITPAHLLTGCPTSQFPDLSSSSVLHSSHRVRHESVRNLVKGFWKTWRNQYLDTLMRKPKWVSSSLSPQIGDIVFIKRSSDPPQSWRLAEIVALHPGQDGVIRVVTVRTLKGTRTESVRNLVPLSVGSAANGGSMNDAA